MRVIDAPQGSDVWLKARVGRITASRIKDVLNFLKNGNEGEKRRSYREELIAERLTQLSADHYTSPEMQHGSEFETFARAAYEMETGVMVDQVGLVLHPSMDFAGASPDGLIGKDGLLEIKCPKTTTHLRWLLSGMVPEEHEPQIMWQMACTGRAWCDFASYDPRLPDGLKLYVCRIERDEERIGHIESEVSRFNSEVDSLVTAFRSRINVVSAIPQRSALEDLMQMVDELVP